MNVAPMRVDGGAERTCPQCGVSFIAAQATQRYCSDKHRHTAEEVRRKARRRQEAETREMMFTAPGDLHCCGWCDEPYALRGRTGAYLTNYCSREHLQIAMREASTDVGFPKKWILGH